jgi:hypothetical protein
MGTTVTSEEGLELPLEPLKRVKLILIFESGLTVFTALPEVVGVVEEE